MKKVFGGQFNKYSVTALVLSVILALSSILLIVSFTGARYVSEVKGDNKLPFETQTPFDVDSQSALVNAIQSGYGYVKLNDNLSGPLIMTGNTLDLIRDLTIDLNGKEIQRTNNDSLITVTSGNSLNIIDTAGGGGLYNPVGSALTVDGGDLNVYGGTFESGPRPEEYYTTISNQLGDSGLTLVSRKVTTMKGAVGSVDTRMILPIRDFSFTSSPNTGSMYFDVGTADTVEGSRMEKDTYCYTVVKGETNDDFSTFDTSQADFAYSYYVKMDPESLLNQDGFGRYVGYVNSDGNFVEYNYPEGRNDEEDVSKYVVHSEDGYVIPSIYREVMVFGFTDDIAKSALESRGEGGVATEAPQYAAVKMLDGTLNVEVTGSQGKDDSRKAGSFYSYFGTWQTYCIYIRGGVMNVNTTGEISTVNPTRLPDYIDGETSSNSAKFSEGACIFSEDKTSSSKSGGQLNITQLKQAASYNGSVISVSGGSVNIAEANISKYMTYSHFDTPFAVDETVQGGAPQFPSDRQYRDAAIFINGGSLVLQGTEVDENARENNLKITVEKYLKNSSGADRNNLPESTCLTSFGILSRGRTGFSSYFESHNVDIVMQGSHSYGVFGTRGDIILNNANIAMQSDFSTYGVYAANRGVNSDTVKEAVKIQLNNAKIDVGGGIDGTSHKTYTSSNAPTFAEGSWVKQSNSAKEVYLRPASIGVYLDSSGDYPGGEIIADCANVTSQELGISVYGGNLTFKNGCNINAYNASAITLRDGNITFEEQTTESKINGYNINCAINSSVSISDLNSMEHSVCSVSDSAQLTGRGKHSYEIFLPYQYNSNTSTAELYLNENGIRVAGGSLVSYGKLNVNFRGLYNDISNFANNSGTDNFRNVVIKSFAVACIAEGASANITLDYADITSYVGGGVKVQGGDIVLGNSSSTVDDIRVETKGHAHTNPNNSEASTNISKWYWGTGNQSATTWQFLPSLSGGYAVIARGGNLIVNNGTYEAAYADAAAVTTDDIAKPPEITINGGTFQGNWTHTTCGADDTYCTGGPMTHYGLKVVGKSAVNVNGGVFSGRNGGLAVMGSSFAAKTAVKVSAGQFGNENAGQDGVNVFDYSDVYFGTRPQTDFDAVKDNAIKLAALRESIKIYAKLFPISTNPIDSSNNNINVYVYYGNYYMTQVGSKSAWGNKPIIKVGIGTIGTPDTTFRIYGLYNNTNVYYRYIDNQTADFARQEKVDEKYTANDNSQPFLRQSTTAKIGTVSTTNRYYSYTDA